MCCPVGVKIDRFGLAQVTDPSNGEGKRLNMFHNVDTFFPFVCLLAGVIFFEGLCEVCA